MAEDNKPSLVSTLNYTPYLTHGIPGIAIGGAIVAGLLVNHFMAAAWSTLPYLICIGMLIFGLSWIYSILRLDIAKKISIEQDTDAGIGLSIGVILSVVGFIGFFVTWTYGHPGPPPLPTPVLDCKNHNGFKERFSRDNDSRAPFYITCNDGYSFPVSE